MKHQTYEEQQERPVKLAEYIIKNQATVRAVAKWYGISKSTAHKDLTERLKIISPSLYPQVKEILETNKNERHIRGGMATKLKYESEKNHLENKEK